MKMSLSRGRRARCARVSGTAAMCVQGLDPTSGYTADSEEP